MQRANLKQNSFQCQTILVKDECLWGKNNKQTNKKQKQIDVSPRFEWQTAISQSARVDETRHSFNRQFYCTAQNHLLSVNCRSPKGPDWSYASRGREKRVVREKNVPNTWALPHFPRTLRHWAEHSLCWWHTNFLTPLALGRRVIIAVCRKLLCRPHPTPLPRPLLRISMVCCRRIVSQIYPYLRLIPLVWFQITSTISYSQMFVCFWNC